MSQRILKCSNGNRLLGPNGEQLVNEVGGDPCCDSASDIWMEAGQINYEFVQQNYLGCGASTQLQIRQGPGITASWPRTQAVISSSGNIQGTDGELYTAVTVIATSPLSYSSPTNLLSEAIDTICQCGPNDTETVFYTNFLADINNLGATITNGSLRTGYILQANVSVSDPISSIYQAMLTPQAIFFDFSVSTVTLDDCGRYQGNFVSAAGRGRCIGPNRVGSTSAEWYIPPELAIGFQSSPQGGIPRIVWDHDFPAATVRTKISSSGWIACGAGQGHSCVADGRLTQCPFGDAFPGSSQRYVNAPESGPLRCDVNSERNDRTWTDRRLGVSDVRWSLE